MGGPTAEVTPRAPQAPRAPSPPRGRLVVAALGAAGFTIALVALVTAQLALMSILDAERAERAAEQIAESRFTAELVEQTVTRAVAPVAGDDLARQVAATTSADPRVIAVVRTSLVNAHREVVDPDAPAEPVDGNEAVGSAIVRSVVDTAVANGVDPATLGFGDLTADDVAALDTAAVARDVGLPEVVPDDLPRLGLRRVAETTRSIALVAIFVAAMIAVLAHPRPGRALRGIGVTVAIVAGTWLLALVLTGWIIGLVAGTLFGEMVEAVWSDAVPAMLLLVGGALVIGVALVLAGIALDGYDVQRRRRAI